MDYRLSVSTDAHNDIDEIINYIACELCNPQAAKDFLDDVHSSYCNVVKNPFMYSLCDDERLQLAGYRKIVIKNFLILYRVDEHERLVSVVRVVYSARNYAEII